METAQATGIVHSVVVLACDKLPWTSLCLESLLASEARDWELVVVDNGSTDGTPQWLEAFAGRTRAVGVPCAILANPSNLGAAEARNQGIKASRGRFITFLDNDTALRSRGWLGRLAAVLERAPAAGMVGPKLVYPRPPHDIQCAGAAISPSGRVQFRGRGESRLDRRFCAEREVQCLISACCMVRREALDKAGLFDPAFHPVQFEDFDLCYRIREAGFRILYTPEVEVYHFESVTTAGSPDLNNSYAIARNGLLFKNRWRHRFAVENGPPDAETAWRKIEPCGLVGPEELPILP